MSADERGENDRGETLIKPLGSGGSSVFLPGRTTNNNNNRNIQPDPAPPKPDELADLAREDGG